MRRRLLVVLVLAFLAVATFAHVRHHYGARERSRVPGDDPPARLLAPSAPGDAALWIAHPHQNLARLAGEIDDLDAYLAAVGRRLGASSPPPTLPGFGPFRLPPSRSLAVAWSDDGDRFLVVADVYPAVRLLGRAAGTVAGNPWLAGGEVEVDGQPATVSWDGGVWTLATDGFGTGELPATSGQEAPALAAVRLAAPRQPFPAGAYRLYRDDPAGGLVLERPAADGAAPPPAPELELADAGVAALLVRGAGAPGWREPFPGPGGIAWVGGMAGGSFDLTPRAAVFELDRSLGGGGWELPRNPLSRLFDELGSGAPSERVGPVTVEASDPETLRRAVPLAPEALRLATLERPRLVLGLWLDPDAVVEALGGASGLLDDLPFLALTDEGRAVRDWEILLAPLEGHGHVALVVAEEPASFRLEISP